MIKILTKQKITRDYQQRLQGKPKQNWPAQAAALIAGWRPHLQQLTAVTNRNVVLFYEVDDNLTYDDVEAFRRVVKQMDHSKGVDFIIHTCGGAVVAAEQISLILRFAFHNDVRTIVPQKAHSAGTLLACAGQVIIMTPDATLSSVDPKLTSADPKKRPKIQNRVQDVIDEYNYAEAQIAAQPARVTFWQELFSRHQLGDLINCVRNNAYTETILAQNLALMFQDEQDPRAAIQQVASFLNNRSWSKAHQRYYPSQQCAQQFGLKVHEISEQAKNPADRDLYAAVWNLHNALLLSFYQLQDFTVKHIIDGNNVTSPAVTHH